MNPLSAEIQNRFVAEYNIQDITTILKELLENSLDSGATAISIKLINYGQRGLQITDNGSGIRSSDFPLICHQGATSKMINLSEISELKNFGFRGMALFSISKISKIVIETKHSFDEFASKLFIQDGKIVEKVVGKVLNGTSVFVSEVFIDKPVRLKDFGTKKEFYLRRIVEIVQSYCVVFFDRKISLVHEDENGKVNILVPCVVCNSLENRLRCVVGGEVFENFKRFGVEKNGFAVEMWMSNPAAGMQKKMGLFFLNKRLMDMPTVIKRISNVYFGEFKRGWSYVMCLVVEKGFDVNVSVDKMKVYFEDEKSVAEFVSEFFKSVAQDWMEGVNMINFLNPASVVKQKTGTISIKVLKKTENSILPINYKKDPISLSSFEFKSVPKPSEPQIPPTATFAQMPLHSDSAPPPTSTFTSIPVNSDPAYSTSQPAHSLFTHLQIPSVSKQISPIKQTPTLPPSPQKINSNPSLPTQFFSNPTSSLTLSWSLSKIQARPVNINPSPNPQQSIKKNLTKDVSLVFHKTDFSKLQLIGQFNKGFIMTCKDSKIFIVDQHAADEKYLFENLQMSTNITKQPLIVEINLELTPSDELLVIEHMDAFESNGFLLMHYEKKDSGSRLSLQTVPMSKNIVFGKEDFYEMVMNLKRMYNAVGSRDLSVSIRCRKFRDMFASRACRTAVMIGTGLADRKMKEILNNLQGLSHPWNCPHGRPTIKLLNDIPNLSFPLPKPKYDSFLN